MSQVNKPVYWVEGEEDDPELGFISLQIDEDEGTAECGCRLVRAEENTGDPAFFLCAMHSAAPDMREALTRMIEWIDAGCDPSNKSIESARAALALAKGKS